MPLRLFGNDFVVSALFDARAVGFSYGKAIKFKQGVLSPGAYINNRVLPSYPKSWNTVLGSLIQHARSIQYDYDVIVGVANGGIPHGAVLAHQLQKPYLTVRDGTKKHGLGGQVDGDVDYIKSGARVLLVEDMSSTFESSLRSMDILKELSDDGNPVTHTLLLNTWNLPDFKRNIERHSVHALCTGDEMLDVAVRRKLVDPEYERLLRNWLLHPEDESWYDADIWR